MSEATVMLPYSIAAVFIAELSRAMLPLMFPKRFPSIETRGKSESNRSIECKNTNSKSIHDFRVMLESERIRRGLDGKRVTLEGFFYPGILLTNGWWERGTHKSMLPSKTMADGLQKWLIHGFEQWAPSWECSLLDSDTSQPYVIGQIGEGDEADSIPVIIPREKALDIMEHFGKPSIIRDASMASRACVSARLQVAKDLKSDLKRQLEMSIPGWTKYGRHCLLLDEHDNTHFVHRRSNSDRGIYSGYLWQCICSKRLWREKGAEVALENVYFVWEHTDFACGDAVKFGIDALVAKREMLEKQVGKTVLLQRSAWVVETRTTDNPVLSIGEFWQFVNKKLDNIRPAV